MGVLISSLQKIGGIEGHDVRFETALASHGHLRIYHERNIQLDEERHVPTNGRIFAFKQAANWKIK